MPACRFGILLNCFEEGSELNEHFVMYRRYRKVPIVTARTNDTKKKVKISKKRYRKIKRLDHSNYSKRISEEKVFEQGTYIVITWEHQSMGYPLTKQIKQ